MIELKRISKNYGHKVIFSDLSLTLESGKLIALVGPSGAGKTTLLNLIGLLDLDYQGKILVDGVDTKALNSKQRMLFIRNRINYLFQDYALVENLTVKDNLLLALEYCKMSKNEKLQEITQALEKVDLSESLDHKVYELSGGEQQRVALARTMIKPGKIILADEPTGNLDEGNKQKVFSLLESLRSPDRTIIIVTHDKQLAGNSDLVITLNDELFMRQDLK